MLLYAVLPIMPEVSCPQKFVEDVRPPPAPPSAAAAKDVAKDIAECNDHTIAVPIPKM
jgi:hypothetical protein